MGINASSISRIHVLFNSDDMGIDVYSKGIGLEAGLELQIILGIVL